MLVGIPPYYDENISKGRLKIPKYLSTKAKNLFMVSLKILIILEIAKPRSS